MNTEWQATSTMRAAFEAHSEQSPNDDCPTPEQLWETVMGQASVDEITEVVLHTSQCPDCAAHWRMARDIHQDLEAEAVTAKVTPFRRFMNITGILAAAALAIFAILSIKHQQRDPHSEIIRQSLDQHVVSTIEDQSLNRQNCLLTWSAPDPELVLHYQILVLGQDLQTVAQNRQLKQAAFLVPESELLKRQNLQELNWRVTVVYQDGRTIASPTFTNLLK